MTTTTRADSPTDAGLRRGVMSGPELAAQAIANIAPSAVIAFTAASIFIGAGNGTIYSFVLATIVILCVGYCVVVFARKHASAGSLYTYVAKGLGPTGAYLAGVSLVIGCWGIAAGSLGGAVSYFNQFLVLLGVPAGGVGWYVGLAIVLGGLATLFTIRGIRLSARVSLVLELVSVTIITILLIAALVWAGPAAWDPAQVFAEGAPFQGIAAGMVLGILGFVGFSSADALGREAKNPYTAIPRAIMWSAVVVGVLYVFAAYTQIAVLHGDLATSASPLEDIAKLIGMPAWFGPILTFGVGASFFAVVVAPLNVVGRVIYVMGKEGVVPERFGRTTQFCDPRRGHMFMPIGRSRQRFELAVLPGEDQAAYEDPAFAWQWLAETHGLGPEDVRILRQVVYTFQGRIAEQWRWGRVLLAGDAAHTMPPYMGQGACSGMRDGITLAWKLDLVLRGLAGDELLDSYEAERRPHATAIMEISTALGKVANTHDPAEAAARDEAFRTGNVPAPPPFPTLVAGVVHHDDEGAVSPLAGTLTPHGVVRHGGEECLFDDVLGRGFSLVTASAVALDPADLAFLDKLGAVAASLDAVVDVDGTYAGWFAEHDVEAFVGRPDHHLFWAGTLADLPAALAQLRERLDWTAA